MNLKEMIGKAAPAFTLPDASGKDYVFDPSSIQGPVVLFFYSQAQVRDRAVQNLDFSANF